MTEDHQFKFYILNSIFFSGILFTLFLLQSCKERERQQQLANKWARLNEKIKEARVILAFRSGCEKNSHPRITTITTALNIATDLRPGFQFNARGSDCEPISEQQFVNL